MNRTKNTRVQNEALELLDGIEVAIGEAITYSRTLQKYFKKNGYTREAGETEYYLIAWLTNFIHDRNQLGSVASLKEAIREM